MSRYSMYSFSSSALTLRQMDGQSFRMNAVKSAITPGGAIDRAHVGLSRANPRGVIQTRDLATVFAAVSPSTVLPFTSGVMRLQKRAEAGTFATSTNHETIDVARGVIIPRNISAAQNDDQGASLDLDIVALYDESNAIVDRTGSVDFSAVSTPTFVSRYFLGPIYINSVIVPNIERVSIDFGINYGAKGFNGSPYPTEGSIITRAPMITFTSSNASIDTSLGLLTRALAGTLAVYLQKGASNSDRVAAGTGGHCKLSWSAGEWCTDEIAVSGNDDGTSNFTVMPTSEAAVTLTSTIP